MDKDAWSMIELWGTSAIGLCEEGRGWRSSEHTRKLMPWIEE